jgi:hypothetical protein
MIAEDPSRPVADEPHLSVRPHREPGAREELHAGDPAVEAMALRHGADSVTSPR